MATYRVVGVMSGTSLDGLDLAFCELYEKEHSWSYQIREAITLPYDNAMVDFLSETSRYSGRELEERNITYGTYIGREVMRFLKAGELKADLVASHGHTIFHQPQTGLTYQLGSGDAIAKTTGIITISDFRSLDVSNGGQGAPLVPVGDEYLFREFRFCLNLGGFSNVSYSENNKRKAFDICPVNIFINHMCRKIGKEYDDKGQIAFNGNINTDLLNQLNGLQFYLQKPPKSLSREWLEKTFLPVTDMYRLTVEDTLRTAYEHFAIQISGVLNKIPESRVLVTGGGVFNEFLMDLISQKTTNKLEIPDTMLVRYKEALVFALLGVLRYRKEINCFSSVTGARCDSSTGVIHSVK